MGQGLLADLNKGNTRQGWSGAEQARLAITLADLSGPADKLQIADMGRGTGVSTLTLAENLRAKITAVDLFQDFLDSLRADVEK